MKNKISPAAIGMFVMAASIIAVAAVMVFGAAKFFSRTENFISFFSESVNGLDVGAPLKYKGVKIGKVEGIFISSSKNIKESSVSVVYSIDIDQLRRKTGTDFKDYSDWMDEQIAEGLRAKLNYQSIVTGMLYIELDFIADKGEKYDLKYGGTRFKEIPAAKSGLSELAKGFEKTMADVAKIDFAGIGQNVHSAIVKVNEKLDAIDAKAISDNAVSALKGVDDLVRNRDVAEAIKKLDVLGFRLARERRPRGAQKLFLLRRLPRCAPRRGSAQRQLRRRAAIAVKVPDCRPRKDYERLYELYLQFYGLSPAQPELAA